MRICSWALPCLLLLSGTAVAQGSSGTGQSGPEEEIKVVGKKICKMETSIGSMMPRRVCRTKTESGDQARGTAEGMARLQQLQQIQDIQRQAKCRGVDSAC